MVVTGTSSVTTFGTQTFLQTVRVDITGAPHPPTEAPPHPHPEDTAGVPQPHPEETAGAHPQPEETAGAPHPQPEDAATPHPLATGTSSVTVWYEPISLVTVREL